LISQETIDKIFESSRIEEVIGDYITLKKRGVNFLGLCPFHNEKTPSFTVSPAKGIYKCFGCGASGNAVKFLMDHEQFSYAEALKYLAKKYNITIEETRDNYSDIEQNNEKESLFAVNSFALKHFTNNLHNTQLGKAIALTYFKERGFSEEIINTFQLGYSIDEWTYFTDDALKNSFKEGYLIETGLTIKKDNKLFDRFKGRIIFPIHNISGRILGFGGRILTNDKKAAKYLNSPESPIYNKSKILYGLHFSKKKISETNNCYLVEGYTDVISLYQAGIENVVASSGTSLTHDQIKLIRRYAENITILYDGDLAGLKASFRGIDMILEEGLNVKILTFPEGEDPDSYSKKLNNTEFIKFINENTKDFISYKNQHLIKEAGNDPLKRAEIIKEMVMSISVIPDSIKRSVYVKECSRILNIEESALYFELNKIIRNKIFKNDKDDISVEVDTNLILKNNEEFLSSESKIEYQEKDIIRILLKYGEDSFPETISDGKKTEIKNINVSAFIVNEFINDEIEFKNQKYQSIFNIYKEYFQNNKVPNINFFINNSDNNISSTAIDLISNKYTLCSWEKHNIYVEQEVDKLRSAVLNSVYAFKLKTIELLIEEKEKEIKIATENNEEYSTLINEFIQYKNIQRQISAILGRIIIK